MKMEISSGVCYAKYHFSKTDNFISRGVCDIKSYFSWTDNFVLIYGEIYQYFILNLVFSDKTHLIKQMYKCVCVLAA